MKALGVALLAARREFGAARKDKSNPAFKSKYATLESVMDAIDEPLSRHGVIYWQSIEPGTADAPPSLVLTVMHAESGETATSTCPLLSDASGRANPMQVLGSAVSYAARYTLLRFFGLSQEDDDGEGAYPRQQPQRYEAPRPQQPARPAAPAANGHEAPRKSFAATVMERAGSDDYHRVMNHFYGWASRCGFVNGQAADNDLRKQQLNAAATEHRAEFAAEWTRYISQPATA
jgi:hypothetical protein